MLFLLDFVFRLLASALPLTYCIAMMICCIAANSGCAGHKDLSMTGFGDTKSHLTQLRRQFDGLPKRQNGLPRSDLVENADFGPNPGNLSMLSHVPASLEPGAALVVALHGCTQTAAGA